MSRRYDLIHFTIINLVLLVPGRVRSEPTEVIEVTAEAPPAAARERERAFLTARAETVVSREDMARANPGSLADALRDQSSVSVQQTTPGQGTVSVRGMSGRSLLYVVDGIRLNTAMFRAGNNETLGLVDPWSLATVRVLPGAASVEYGSDALGGAVDMRTERPGFGEGKEQRVQLSLGSNPLGAISHYEFDIHSENWASVGGVTSIMAGPIRPGEGGTTPEPSSYLGLVSDENGAYHPNATGTQYGTEYQAHFANLALRRRLARRSDLTLATSFALRPRLIRYDRITPRYKNELPSRAQAELSPLTRATASLRYERRPVLPGFRNVSVFAGFQQLRERRLDRRLNELCLGVTTGEDCAGPQVLAAAEDQAVEVNRSDAVSLRASALTIPSPWSNLSFGLDGWYDRVTSSAHTRSTATRARESAPARYPSGSAVGELGSFVNSELAMSSRLKWFLGLRGSGFLTDIQARRGTVTAPAIQKLAFDWSGSLGARLELLPELAWSGNLGRGVRSPNVEDYAGLGSRAQGRTQVPNRNLGAEHSLTLDSGLKYRGAGHEVQTFVFWSRVSDAIVLGPTTVDGSDTSPTEEAYVKSINASSVTHRGVESSARLSLLSTLLAHGRLLFMLGEERNPASTGLPRRTPADRVPPYAAEFGLECTQLTALRVDGFVRHRAAQDRLNDPVNLDDNRIPLGGTPAFTTLHLHFAYTPNPGLRLSLALDNLTDALVLEHGSGFYSPGFSATAGLAATF